MFRKAILFGGLLLLAGATVLVTPGSGQAQHRGGGGHGGGFHGGGFHGGGFHGGSFHGGGFHGGGFNRGFNHGAFNHSFNHGGFNRGFNHGFNHGGFNRGFNHGFNRGGLWFPGSYGYYGAWPYSYGYSYPYSYDPYSYGSLSPSYDSGYYDSYGDLTSPYPDSYSPAPAQPDTSARVTVSVPADAEVWFEGSKRPATGSVREYQSPPLTPGVRYTYDIRARWNENGKEVTQTQQVEVAAGTHVNVHFPVQPTTAPTAPSP
jgi:uncharacterized protein (TIGR03000 family)